MLKNPLKPAESSSVFDSLTIECRKHIAEELFEKIRDAILSGELPSGYIFPNENELCQKLNIGRGSLREAYAPLETLHLITRTKSGTFVNSQEEIHNSMNFEAIAKRSETQNLSEYRQVVEIGMAQLAATKATEQDALRLEDILKQMSHDREDPVKLSQLDFDFHSELSRITNNELLRISFHTIRGIYEAYTERVFALGFLEQSLVDHQALINALRAKDSELAGLMMRRHLEHVEKFRSEN